MFGKDHLILSKPREVKTVAKSFTQAMKKTILPDSRLNTSDNRIKEQKEFEKPRPATKPVTHENRLNSERFEVNKERSNKRDYTEDQIDVYSLKEYNVRPSGVYVQVKGWGNLKELSILNALKNSLSKLAPDTSDNSQNERILYNYTLSSMTALADGGWE